MAARRQAYLEALGVDTWVARTAGAAPVAVPVGIDTATITDVPANDGLDWSTLREQVRGCRACSLCDSRTQTVFGVGSQEADLMIIGEAPGADEDRQGEPFVGRAGKLLDAMLLAIGFRRDQVFIANILKCRPPDNRNPSPEEAAACAGFLRRQIELVAPKRILAVGKVAAQNLLGTDEPVGRMRARSHTHQASGTPVHVSYHPAYLLRQPAEKAKVWADLQSLHAALGAGQ